MTKQKHGSSCRDLDTIVYRTALMDGDNTVRGSASKTNITEVIESYTVNDAAQCPKGWARLGLTEKVALLTSFSKDYCEENELDADRAENLSRYLISAMRLKRLTRASEVEYSKTAKKITGIPILVYCPDTKRFTLKRVKGRVSASAALPKKRSTIKSINISPKDT